MRASMVDPTLLKIPLGTTMMSQSKLSSMTKYSVEQVQDRTFYCKEPVNIITYLQDCKVACNIYNILKRAGIWFFKLIPSDPTEMETND